MRGKLVSRGQGKRADYVLYYKPNIPLALIEAKDNTHSVGSIPGFLVACYAGRWLLENLFCAFEEPQTVGMAKGQQENQVQQCGHANPISTSS